MLNRPQRSLRLGVVFAAAVCLAAAASDKIIIAHRGASGYLPEHTLEAYAMAYAMGADYIEQDLVMTKDGRFIALHDIHLESTTDVEEQFPDRKRSDGRWYAADFTLTEIKRLNVHERLPNRFPQGKARFEVPTFEEAIELVQGLNQSTGRGVGLYPELKAPAWHRVQGLAMEKAFLDIAARYGYAAPAKAGAGASIYVQCFEPASLKKIRGELGSQLPLIELVGKDNGPGAALTEKRLDRIATYANGIGPDRRLIEENPRLVEWAHARGLLVHPYTFRKDAVAPRYPTFADELAQFYITYDVDGLFTDFPDEAARFLRERPEKR